MGDWFTVDEIDRDSFVISEYKHPEETHCYLLCGSKRCLLIDTGLGVADISEVVERLVGKPVIAAATHIHWDHIGGYGRFSSICAHVAEIGWLNGEFPLPIGAVRKMLAEGELPDKFKLDEYTIFQGAPSIVLADGDRFVLGGRTIMALHTPGHSPGHMCFFEPDRGYLFSGDLIYSGTLYANYQSTDPDDYLKSVERMAELSVRRLFPGHHSLNIHPEIIVRVRDGLRELKSAGKLIHGSGKHDYGDWSILL